MYSKSYFICYNNGCLGEFMDKYQLGKYKYFDLLVLINSYFFPSIPIGENMRGLTEDEFKIFDEKLKSFFDTISNTNNLNDISRLSLNLTGYFWMVQPFGDGNTRTLRSFLYFIFSQLNYKLDLTFEPNDVPIIPIFYDEDEKCVENDINNLIRRLTKKE